MNAADRFLSLTRRLGRRDALRADAAAPAPELPAPDALTGLATRGTLERRVGELAATLPQGQSMAVLVLDIYRFFRVNQSWGRAAGDAVLIELARRLRGLGQAQLLARVGADSMAVVLCGDAAERWRASVEQMLKSLREPFEVGPGRTRKLTASIGCALYPHDASSASCLLGLAEAAVFSQSERAMLRRHEQLDPYGAEAAEKLAWLQRFLGPQLQRLNHEFLERLLPSTRDAGGAGSRLPLAVCTDLVPVLGHYAQLLLDPDLQREHHREQACAVGRMQAALGLAPQIGMQAMGHLYQALAGLAQRIPARLSERTLFRSTLLKRMEADIAFQQEGADRLHHELLQGVRDLAAGMQGARRRADLLEVVVQALPQLPFAACCAVYTQDAQGRFVLEAQSAGHVPWAHVGTVAGGVACGCAGVGACADVTDCADCADDAGGERLLERCWLSTDIEQAPDVLRSARHGHAWAQRLLDGGFRSAVAVPVLDGAGHVLVVLKLLGRLPGQFATPFMRHALDSLRYFISAELTRVGDGIALPAVAADERALWRQRLFGGGLRMLMQPIVDLRERRCTRVEALARLRLDSDTLLTPARFLPMLGQQELDRLFLEGLRLSLQSLKAWEREGVFLDLALNLPPSTLRHGECVEWVRKALTHHGVEPQRLSLEILEDRDVATQETMRSTTEQLRALGVRLALDDLGSGYSSLLRLNSLPIDMVKVDQGLVHGIVANNPRAVPLVTGLVDLARRLDLRITVEGLETQILLEYAQYLKADYGQGHAISRPLPPQQIPAWIAGWRLPALSGITPFAQVAGIAGG